MKMKTVSIDSQTIHFGDYADKNDFIAQWEAFYAEKGWELPAGESFGEYWDFHKS